MVDENIVICCESEVDENIVICCESEVEGVSLSSSESSENRLSYRFMSPVTSFCVTLTLLIKT